MEVEGPEDHVVFLEPSVNQDGGAQESAPGIVPDGKNVCGDGYMDSLFSEENVYVQWVCECLLKC